MNSTNDFTAVFDNYFEIVAQMPSILSDDIPDVPKSVTFCEDTFVKSYTYELDEPILTQEHLIEILKNNHINTEKCMIISQKQRNLDTFYAVINDEQIYRSRWIIPLDFDSNVDISAYRFCEAVKKFAERYPIGYFRIG